MWRLLPLILACAVLSGQSSTVPLTFAWDLEPSHDQATAWEVEADGQILPCGSVTVTATDRRCTAAVPSMAASFRLRARTETEIGGWSAPINLSDVAGAYSVTRVIELASPPPPDPEPEPEPMAFPQVAAVSGGGFDGDTNHQLTLPSGIQAGDLLVVGIYMRSGSPSSWPATWERHTFTDIGSASVNLAAGWRYATGDANDDMTIVMSSSSTKSGYTVFRITGHDATIDPQFTQTHEATTDQPNPPSLTPTGGAKDYLWLAFAGWIAEHSVSSYPANYSDGRHDANTASSTDRLNSATARRELNASSEDPGVFVKSGSSASLSFTVAVHPDPGGGGGISIPVVLHHRLRNF